MAPQSYGSGITVILRCGHEQRFKLKIPNIHEKLFCSECGTSFRPWLIPGIWRYHCVNCSAAYRYGPVEYLAYEGAQGHLKKYPDHMCLVYQEGSEADFRRVTTRDVEQGIPF